MNVPKPVPPVLPWLSKTPHLTPLTAGDVGQYSPVLIVGLGRTGAIVLKLLKADLLSRGRGEFPKTVRILQIDSGEYVDQALGFQPYEYLHLTLEDSYRTDFQNLSRRPCFDWLRPYGNSPSPRAHIRTRFFLNIQSREQSPLYSAIRKVTQSFESTPKIFLVANLSETDSVLLWDIAYLLRHKVTEGMGNRWEAAYIASLVACDSQNVLLSDGTNDVFAALRELSRFTSHGLTRFGFLANDLSGISESALVDHCFLLDTFSSGQKGVDLKSVPPEEGQARVICDSLLILIDPHSSDINSELLRINQDNPPGSKEHARTYLSTIGVSSFILPLPEIRKAVELRLLRNVLFGGDTNKAEGIYHVPFDRHSSLTSSLEEAEAGREALDFLRREMQNHHAIFSDIARYYLDPSRQLVYPDMSIELDDLFAAKLATWATDFLNGPEPYDMVCRSNRLFRIRAILESLESILKKVEASLTRPKDPKQRPDPTLQERLRYWATFSQKLAKQVIAWEEILVGPPVDKSRYRATIPERTKTTETLLNLVESDWMNSRRRLREMAVGKIQRAPLLPGEDRPPYLGFEYPFYGRHISPEPESSVIHSNAIMDKFISRIGWFCQTESKDFKIHLVIVPASWNQSENPPQPVAHTLTPSSIARRIYYSRDLIKDAYKRLCNLASYFSRGLLEENLEPYLRELGEDAVADFLTSGLNPLLPEISDQMGDGLILFGEDNDPPQDTHRRFVVSADKRFTDSFVDLLPYKVSFQQRDDNGILSLISFHHGVPLERTRIFENARKVYSQQARAHVYTAEQIAARAEAEIRNQLGDPVYLDKRFVRLLQFGFRVDTTGLVKTVPLVDLFLRTWLYGLVEEYNKREWRMPAVQNFESVSLTVGSMPILDALREFALELPCSTSIHASHPLAQGNIDDYCAALFYLLKSKAETGRPELREQIRKIEKETVKKYLQDPNPVMRSLGYYLKYLIEEERFGNY